MDFLQEVDFMARVGIKGQVVIEKPIRDALGIEPGAVAVQALVGDHVEIRFYPPEHERSLAGILGHRLPKPDLPQPSWEEVRRQAWPETARRRWAVEEGGLGPVNSPRIRGEED